MKSLVPTNWRPSWFQQKSLLGGHAISWISSVHDSASRENRTSYFCSYLALSFIILYQHFFYHLTQKQFSNGIQIKHLRARTGEIAWKSHRWLLETTVQSFNAVLLNPFRYIPPFVHFGTSFSSTYIKKWTEYTNSNLSSFQVIKQCNFWTTRVNMWY